MDDEIELLLIVPVIIAIVAINAAVLEMIGSQIKALEEYNETLRTVPFEYVIDEASGNFYPEALCVG